MVMTEEEGVTPECEVVKSVTDETPTGEGCADKAISPGDEHAPAGDHASAETTATEMHSTTTEAAAAEMHSATAKPAVHATESTTATECHGWVWKGNCRSEHSRGEAPNDSAIHDSDPP